MTTASESKNKLSRSSNSIDGELMKALILFRQLEKSFNAGKLYLILYSVVRTYFGISGIWMQPFMGVLEGSNFDRVEFTSKDPCFLVSKLVSSVAFSPHLYLCIKTLLIKTRH